MRSAPVQLIRHPASTGPGRALALEGHCVVEPDGTLMLRFNLAGDLGSVAVPPATTPARIDGLWRHTCCEAFLGHAGGPDYLELNLSPSGEWAAYRFSGYRTPAPVPEMPAPQIRITACAASLELVASVHPSLWTLLGEPDALHVGLTAVVEGRDGLLSHYALRHPLDRPDFHDPRGCVLRIPRSAAS